VCARFVVYLSHLNRGALSRARDLFVREKVVTESIDDRFGNIRYVAYFAVDAIALKHRDDFIISFILIDDFEATDRACPDKYIPVKNRTIGEDTNIQRISVSLDPLALERPSAQLPDAVAAIGLRNEAVQCRALIGVLLGAVYLENTGILIDFEFYGVGWNDFNVAGYDLWGIFADRNSMPRVCAI
jgi:hypothetical protein